MPTLRLVPLLLLAASIGGFVPWGPTAAAEEETSAQVEVPSGIPVQLDGVVLPAEWEDAARIDVGQPGAALYVKQVRGTLLLGLATSHPWPPRSRLWFMFTPEAEGAGLYAPPAVRLDYEPTEHNRPHLLVSRVESPGREQLFPAEALARSSTRGPRASVEVAVPLAFLGIEGAEAQSLRFALLWARRSPLRALTWPPSIRTDGPDGEPPPDLASSEGWARLRGLGDAEGTGAFSAEEWEEEQAKDAELTRRGAEAYEFGRTLAGGAQLPKSDREQGQLLLGNLAWIREREPLTPDDVLLLARGYRFFNRVEESLATLDTLEAQPGWHGSPRLAYERAIALELRQRYGEALRVWEALGSGRGGSRYRDVTERAHVRYALWEDERKARLADEARDDLPLVLLRTQRGHVVLLLHADDVPRAVEHFLGLVEEQVGDGGFYDGTLFHRVIGEFLAQGGDPESRGDCEAAGKGDGPRLVTPERSERHGFWRGAVGFAMGAARMNGSQFFVLTAPKPELGNEGFTCFGHVIAGMDVVDRIERCDELVSASVLRRGAGPEGVEER